MYDAGYYIVQDGSDTVIGGTSAAAPTLAGMVSLLNDALLAAGKPTLGFLNYFLYQNEGAFLPPLCLPSTHTTHPPRCVP